MGWKFAIQAGCQNSPKMELRPAWLFCDLAGIGQTPTQLSECWVSMRIGCYWKFWVDPTRTTGTTCKLFLEQHLLLPPPNIGLDNLFFYPQNLIDYHLLNAFAWCFALLCPVLRSKYLLRSIVKHVLRHCKRSNISKQLVQDFYQSIAVIHETLKKNPNSLIPLSIWSLQHTQDLPCGEVLQLSVGQVTD
jgi:hypothetical protein